MNDIEKAIEILKEHYKDATMFLTSRECKEYNKAIDLAILTLEEKLDDGWIPVKERLPKQYNEYDSLISNDTDTKMHMVSNLVMVTVINHETNLLFVSNDIVVDGEWANFPNNILGDNYEIIAWQPLPEPYKEAGNERD